MHPALVAPRFSPLPPTDGIVFTSDDTQNVTFLVPPVRTQDGASSSSSSAKKIDHASSGSKSLRASSSSSSSSAASGAASASSAAPPVSKPAKKKSTKNLREAITNLTLCEYVPISHPSLRVESITYDELVAQDRHQHQHDPIRLMKKGLGVAIGSSAEEISPAIERSPWSTRIPLYAPLETSARTYLDMIGAHERAKGLDQIFGGRAHPLKPVILLHNMACDSEVLQSYISVVALLFWVMTRKRVVEYRPDLFNTQYDESYPSQMFIVHPMVDMTFSFRKSKQRWNERAMDMAKLAEAYNFADFVYIVMTMVVDVHGHLLLQPATLDPGSWVENKLQRNGSLYLASRRFTQMNLQNMVKICNDAIQQKWGNAAVTGNNNKCSKLVQKWNRWYPQVPFRCRKIELEPSHNTRLKIPAVYRHHWFSTYHPLLTWYGQNDPTRMSCNVNDYRGDEEMLRQVFWELSFFSSLTIRTNVDQGLSNFLQLEIDRLNAEINVAQHRLVAIVSTLNSKAAVNSSHHYAAALVAGSTGKDSDEHKLRDELQRLITERDRLLGLKKSPVLVKDTYPGHRFLNFVALRYSFFVFKKSVYYAPPWPMIRPTFVVDEASFSFLNAVKTKCLITHGLALHTKLQPNALSRLKPTDNLGTLIAAINDLPGTTQHSNVSLAFPRFNTVGAAYRGVLVPLRLYTGDTVDPRWVHLPALDSNQSQWAYVSLHDEPLDAHGEQLVDEYHLRDKSDATQAWDDFQALVWFGICENDVVRTVASRMGAEKQPGQVAQALRTSFEAYQQQNTTEFAACMTLHESGLRATLSQMLLNRNFHEPLPVMTHEFNEQLINTHSVSNLLQSLMPEAKEDSSNIMLILTSLIDYALLHMDRPLAHRAPVIKGVADTEEARSYNFMVQRMVGYVYDKLVKPVRVKLALVSRPLSVPLPEGKRWGEVSEAAKDSALKQLEAQIQDTIRAALRKGNLAQDIGSLLSNTGVGDQQQQQQQQMADTTYHMLSLAKTVLQGTKGHANLAKQLEPVLASQQKQEPADNAPRKSRSYLECRRTLVASVDTLQMVSASVWDSMFINLAQDDKNEQSPVVIIKELIEDVCKEKPARRSVIGESMILCKDHAVVKALSPTPAAPLTNKRARDEVRDVLFTKRKSSTSH